VGLLDDPFQRNRVDYSADGNIGLGDIGFKRCRQYGDTFG